jgi:hypothetical protein
MKVGIKRLENLTRDDLQIHAVWQFMNVDDKGETLVRPIARIPVGDLSGKLVGTQVHLANSTRVWALLGNVDVRNPRLTEHFLTISLERNGKWFALARYHDFDYLQRGPNALADFLKLRVDHVFPISFDLTQYAKGDAAVLAGEIPILPREQLSRAEIIALAVP